MGSQFTRSGNTKSVSIVRAAAPMRNSLTTCCKIGSRSTPASRESVKAATETAARKVQNVVDQARHPDDAALHHVQNLRAPFAQSLLAEKAGAASEGGERVAQIVAEHGDELLAQRGRVLFVEGSLSEVH